MMMKKTIVLFNITLFFSTISIAKPNDPRYQCTAEDYHYVQKSSAAKSCPVIARIFNTRQMFIGCSADLGLSSNFIDCYKIGSWRQAGAHLLDCYGVIRIGHCPF